VSIIADFGKLLESG